MDSVIHRRVFTPSDDLPTQIKEAIDHSSKPTNLTICCKLVSFTIFTYVSSVARYKVFCQRVEMWTHNLLLLDHRVYAFTVDHCEQRLMKVLFVHKNSYYQATHKFQNSKANDLYTFATVVFKLLTIVNYLKLFWWIIAKRRSLLS